MTTEEMLKNMVKMADEMQAKIDEMNKILDKQEETIQRILKWLA